MRPPLVPEIDVLLHAPARLRLLAMVEETDFMYVLRQTGLSRGNLSVQRSRLETAGLVHLEKELVGGRPRSRYCLTEKGRESRCEYKRTLLGPPAPFPD